MSSFDSILSTFPCIIWKLSYNSSNLLKANLRIVVYDIDPENNTKQILSAKEQEVFIGDLP